MTPPRHPLLLLLLAPAAALAAVPWGEVWEVARNPFAIGFVGAVITALRFTPGAGAGERIGNVIAGAVVAGFAAPAVCEWTDLTRTAYVNLVALTMGLTGVSLAAAVVQAAKNQVPALLERVLSLWTLRGK